MLTLYALCDNPRSPSPSIRMEDCDGKEWQAIRRDELIEEAGGTYHAKKISKRMLAKLPVCATCGDVVDSLGYRKVLTGGLLDASYTLCCCCVRIVAGCASLEETLQTARMCEYPPNVIWGSSLCPIVTIHTYIEDRGYQITMPYIIRNINTLDELLALLQERRVDLKHGWKLVNQ